MWVEVVSPPSMGAAAGPVAHRCRSQVLRLEVRPWLGSLPAVGGGFAALGTGWRRVAGVSDL